MPLNKGNVINSGHGLYLEGGINPGNLISRKTLIGIYIGFGFQDRLWSTSFNKDFSNDYGASIDREGLTGIDSSIILASAKLFHTKKGTAPMRLNCETGSFHNYTMYYGLQINLPFKYSPIIKLYHGTTRSYFQGDGSIATKAQDFNIFELRRNTYGCEFAFPLKTSTCNNCINKIISVSAYIEYNDLYRSSLYFYDGTEKKNISLSAFTNSSFRNKYRNEFYCGFKLNILLY